MTGIKMSARAMATLMIAIGTEIGDRDTEINRHHTEIDKLKETESRLTQELSARDYSFGDLNGQVTDLTERLRLAEESNKNFFNANQQLIATNKAVIDRESELSSELESLKEGKPVVLANAENVRGLIQAMLTGDAEVIGLQVHKLMDLPYAEAILFAKNAISGAAYGEPVVPSANTMEQTVVGPDDQDDEVVVVPMITAKTDRDDDSGVVSSIDPSAAEQSEQGKTAAEVEEMVG